MTNKIQIVALHLFNFFLKKIKIFCKINNLILNMQLSQIAMIPKFNTKKKILILKNNKNWHLQIKY